MSDDRFVPEETDAQGKALVDVLQQLYATQSEDAQSLATIRERLVEKSAHGLPLPATESPYRIQRHRKDSPMQITESYGREKRGFSRPLMLIAAVLLIAIVTGSFAWVRINSQSAVGGDVANTIHLHSGWKVQQSYSGKGNQKLTGLHVAVPAFYEWHVACHGSGSVNAVVNGRGIIAEIGTGDCQAPNDLLEQPDSPDYAAQNAPQPVVDSINVKASDSVTWTIYLLQAIKQPSLKLGTEWRFEMGIGAAGVDVEKDKGLFDTWKINSSVNNEVGGNFGGASTAPKTWSLVTLCRGTGRLQVTLADSPTKVTAPICDGQPKLTIIRYAYPVQISSIKGLGSRGLAWYMQLFACVNEQACKQTPASQIVNK